MKGLTIHQPWAGLMVGFFPLRLRKCEARCWNTSYRGTLLIHAGLEINNDDLKTAQRLNLPMNNLKLGAILGIVDLFETRQILTEEDWKKEFPNSLEKGQRPYGNKTFLWFMRNAVLFEEPIFCRGLLGLWDPPAEIMRKLSIARG